ncbi:hypothetical protein NPIL_647071 [Nephila pilipes]|uniref:Uncharacterized protein n=1 Tax=Nephila pilipes TaxID=299642 RepID=A0A8X6JK20_NEPPI|nr:hypothetical protein NPIL_647071 [Nephila pilipes]
MEGIQKNGRIGLNDWSRAMLLSSNPTHSPTFSCPVHSSSSSRSISSESESKGRGCLQIGQVLFVFMCLIRQWRWNTCPHTVFSAQCIICKQMAQLFGVSKIVLGQWSPYRKSSTV